MKALLSGASSFSGLWFARALAERSVEVIAPLRAKLDAYSGVRGARVKALHEVAKVYPQVEFGSPEFFSLFDRSSCDLLCHHAARVTDYRSPDFDINLALAENTRGLKALSERLAAGACKAVVLTGSVFEPDEGAGTEPLRAFSPYGLSKALTSSVFRYWCEVAGLPLGKFVIANPFGPLEEPRFCAYLIKTWAAGEVAEVRTPRYVRDNIHVSLLAKAYADFALQTVNSRRAGRNGPSFYVESQGAFAERFAREIGQRVTIPCRVKVGIQTDFAEPLVRINTDPVDTERLGWIEAEAWDQLADYYAQQLPVR
jgi:nucleoside-diphosphate-sugar epimerase